MKALVAIQNFAPHKIGDVVLKTSEEYVGYLLSCGHCAVVEYDESIQFPKAILVPETLEQLEYWSKEGFENAFNQPLIEDNTWEFHPAEGEEDEYWTKDEARVYEQPVVNDDTWEFHGFVAAVPEHYEIIEDGERLKTKTVEDLHTVMEQEVLEQMATVFGTTNPESATAYKQTYDLMLAKPSLFVGKLGLTDEESITSYATAKVAAIEEYAVWRMERIAQFKIERDAILGA